MTREEIIAAIDEELSRLQQVRALLESSSVHKIFAASPRAMTARKKRVLSPEARGRIADAQKRRWAKQKKADTQKAGLSKADDQSKTIARRCPRANSELCRKRSGL